MAEDVPAIPCYKIVYRCILVAEIVLICICVGEFICLMVYYSEEIFIIVINLMTILLLSVRIFLLVWTYVKARFRGYLMCAKTTMFVFILFLNSFKTLLIADIEEESGLGLLFANTIIINLLALLFEVGSYGILYMKIKYLIKVPSKKDSTIRTKKNSNTPFKYDQLVNTANSKEQQVLEEMSHLSFVGQKNEKQDTGENNDQIEDIINDIVKEEQKTASNIFSDSGSVGSYGSLASLRKQRLLESGESPQFGTEVVREESKLNSSSYSPAKNNTREELQNAYMKNNGPVNVFEKRPSSFSFMGSDQSSQTSESQAKNGVSTSSIGLNSETRTTPQFSAFPKSIKNKSSLKSLPSSSPFRNTLAQKAEMVRMQKSGFLAQEFTNNKSVKRNSAVSKRPHISISSIYTVNSGDESKASGAFMSYEIQLADQPKSQIVSSLSFRNDPSSSDPPLRNDPSSESI